MLHICDTCMKNLPFCAGKGKQMHKGHIAFLVSPFCYTKGVSRMIKLMKFHGKYSFADTLAAFMAENLKAVCDIDKIDIVMPVPMTKKQISRRGYNQAALLAKGVAKRCGLPLDTHSLQKTRETKAQSGLCGMESRTQNVCNAFSCVGDLEDKTVLLVDDVYTTGQTAKNCAKALKVAGAGDILLLTAASAHAQLAAEPAIVHREGENVLVSR